MGWPYQQKPPVGWPLDYDSGLVPNRGFWPLWENGGGKVFNIVRDGNHGILIADTKFVPGKFGTALEFDAGGDDYVDFGLLNMASWPSFTASILVCWDSIGAAEHTVFGNWDGGNDGSFMIRLEPGTGNPNTVEAFTVTLADGQIGGSFIDLILTDLTKHHIVVVYDGSTLSAYLDGRKSSTTYAGNGPLDNTASSKNLNIGRSHDGPRDYFTGLLDIPAIWNGALIASEVALLYQYPFWMFKDPAEMLLNYPWSAAAAGILPQITSAYMKVSA